MTGDPQVTVTAMRTVKDVTTVRVPSDGVTLAALCTAVAQLVEGGVSRAAAVTVNLRDDGFTVEVTATHITYPVVPA